MECMGAQHSFAQWVLGMRVDAPTAALGFGAPLIASPAHDPTATGADTDGLVTRQHR